MKIYLVGGALRDRLLGLPVKDRDWVVVGATVEEMLARGYRQVGRDFPVFLDPRSKEEYALARTERKAGNGYTGFVVHASPEVTLEEDLQRRDLSINAMAEDAEGRLIDPYGGRADLDKRVLRHVSPAFAEDPLRVLRVARFAARFAHLGFRVADETLALMRDMSASGELTHLVPERVWQELQRALEESSPAVFFETLRACAALAVILPELEALFGVPQDPATHRESDVGRHSLLALQEAAALGGDTAVRFAALCHDLGKGHSPRQHWPAHPGHAEAGARSIVALCARLKAPVEHRELARLASLLHARIQQAAALDAEQLLALLEDMDALRRPRRAGQLLRVCEALARCRPGKAEEAGAARALLQRAAAAAAGLSAEALVAAGLRGPAVGEQLRLQRISVIGELLKAST